MYIELFKSTTSFSDITGFYDRQSPIWFVDLIAERCSDIKPIRRLSVKEDRESALRIAKWLAARMKLECYEHLTASNSCMTIQLMRKHS